MLYFAMIYPRILYGIEVYANTYLTHLHNLMVLNNRLLRILQHRKLQTNTSELYLLYGSLPINKLFKFQILLHAHNIFFNSPKLPKIFRDERLLNSDIHTYSTRSSHDFHRLSVNSASGSKISLNLCTKYWNALPPNIKSISEFTLFKTNLKSFIFSESAKLSLPSFSFHTFVVFDVCRFFSFRSALSNPCNSFPAVRLAR